MKPVGTARLDTTYQCTLIHFIMPQLIDRAVGPKGRIFRGFAEPSRLRIIDALRDGEMTVSEICVATDLAQPNVSNHLACLLGCRLVQREPRGRQVFYSLADERIEALLVLSEEIASGIGRGTSCCPVCGSES